MHIVRVEQTQASSANAVTLSPVTLPHDLSVHLARPFLFFPLCPPTCTRYFFSATFSAHLLSVHSQYQHRALRVHRSRQRYGERRAAQSLRGVYGCRKWRDQLRRHSAVSCHRHWSRTDGTGECHVSACGSRLTTAPHLDSRARVTTGGFTCCTDAASVAGGPRPTRLNGRVRATGTVSPASAAAWTR
jgi:hypothetical protein